MAKKSKRISAAEFRKRFGRMIDAHLSKLSPKERHERIQNAHALASKLVRDARPISSENRHTPAYPLAAHTRAG